MTLQPLLGASALIQIHVLTAVLALLLGSLVLFRRKGTWLHRLGGRLWVLLMLVTALSSFGIHGIGTFGRWSFIHIVSVYTIGCLIYAVMAVRNGNIPGHKKAMQSIFIGALLVAGALSFLPGRIMNAVLSGVDKMPAPVSAPSTAGNGVATFIFAHTPLWVWPLLASLILLGWLRSRARVINRTQLLVAPTVVAIMSLFYLFSNGWLLAAVTGFVCGALPGIAFGRVVGSADGVYLTPNGKYHVPGEWLSMTILMGLFLVRYIDGFMATMDPALPFDPPWLFGSNAASGLLAATMVARSLTQLRCGSGEPALKTT